MDEEVLRELEMVSAQRSTATDAMLIMAQTTSTIVAAIPVVIGENDTDSEDDSDDIRRPGRGNAVIGQKSFYVRRVHRSRINFLLGLNNPNAFESKCHFKLDEFEAYYELVRHEIEKPMDVRMKLSDGENFARKPRARSLPNKDFFYLEALGGFIEGSVGVERLWETYGFTEGAANNYFRHAAFAVYRTSKAQNPHLIRLPSANKRQQMHGLMPDFPKCECFVDGNKARFLRLRDRDLNSQRYNGYKNNILFQQWSSLTFSRDTIGSRLSTQEESPTKPCLLSLDFVKQPFLFLSEETGAADKGYADIPRLGVPEKESEPTVASTRYQKQGSLREADDQ